MRLALALAVVVACKSEKQPEPAPAPEAKPMVKTYEVPASGDPPADPVVAIDEPPPPLPPPSKAKPSAALVDGMRGLCATSEMSPPDAKEAIKKWLEEQAGNKELAELYLRALTVADEDAMAKLRGAADAAVGIENCGMLDSLLIMARKAPR